MKFKTLCKVLSAVKYELVVYDKNDRFKTSFIVDYLNADGNDNILHKCDLEDVASVISVSSYSCTGLLRVTVKV